MPAGLIRRALRFVVGGEATTLGGAEGIRTPDPFIANEVRYQLRHSPWVRPKL